jgi:hypothetical protein
MQLTAFRDSLAADTPPERLPPALQALWWQGRGHWDRAHAIVQADERDPVNAWVHAHLHRVEGDLGNAGYWYRRAGRPAATGSLDAEWAAIATELLAAVRPGD